MPPQGLTTKARGGRCSPHGQPQGQQDSKGQESQGKDTQQEDIDTQDTIPRLDGNEQYETQNPKGDCIESPWEAQVGWVYAGHGEWIQTKMDTGTEHGNPLLQEPSWIKKWWKKNDQDIALHHAVRAGGYLNIWGAQILIPTKWNLQRFSELLADYPDKEVVEWL